MTLSDESGKPDLAWLRQCDALCDEFESAWKAGRRAELALFIGRVPADRRRDLLRALLPLELEYRATAGETPRPADYTALWPEHSALIDDLFRTTVLERTIDPPASQHKPDSGTCRANQPLADNNATLLQTEEPAAPPAPLAASRVGEYAPLRELGRGGMGVVYLARHERLGRLAAVKVIRAGQFAHAAEIDRFRAEAAAAAQLDHPGIVPVYESGTCDGHHYLAMAYVEGDSLAQRIKEHPLEPRLAAGILEQVAQALCHAHERGVVHRDLKPHNILLGADGRPRVVDFGLAKRHDVDSNLTATGDVLGTPGYMPPEQAIGKADQAGPAADIYSAGATLYCALTGRPPFQAANPIDTLRLVCEQEPVPPRALNARIPRDLETICLKCLRKDPRARYASARELAEDLARFRAGKPILARPTGAAERAWRWCRRNPVVAGLAAAAVTLLATVAGVSTWAYTRQRDLTSRLTVLAGEEKSQREQAELQRQLAIEQRERAVRQLYASQVARGANAIDTGNFSGALAALDDTAPLRVRGWEYGFLKQRLAGTPLTIVDPQAPLYRVAFRGDGRMLATGSLAGTIDLWNLADGSHARRLEAGSAPRMLAFHPRHGELIAALVRGAIMVWNQEDDQPRLTWTAHDAPLADAAINADGSLLATAGADGGIRLWDPQTGDPRYEFRGHTQPARCVAFSPDGQRAASGGSAGNQPFELLLWEAQTGNVLSRAATRLHSVEQVRFNPNGAQLATLTGAVVSFWNARDLAHVQTLEPQSNQFVSSISFSADGAHLAMASFDGVLRLWDLPAGRLARQYGHHAEPVLNTQFGPDGYLLASVSGPVLRRGESAQRHPGVLKVWNIREPQSGHRDIADARAPGSPTNYLNAVAFEPGSTVIAAGGWHRKVTWNDALTGAQVAPPLDAGCVIMRLQFHPRLPILAICGTTAGPYNGLALHDRRTGQTRALPGHQGRFASALFSHGGQVLASIAEDRVIRLWNPQTAEELGALTGHTVPVAELAFSADDQRLFSRGKKENEPDEVIVWDLVQRRRIPDARPPASRGLLSPDFSVQAQRLADGTITIWSASADAPHQLLRGHLADVTGMAFTPDGRRLVSAARDGTLRVWDPHEGLEMLRIGLEPDTANDVAIGGDGTLIACATQSGMVRVWDARGVSDELQLKGHTQAVAAWGFAPDGRLVSRDAGGLLLAWDLGNGTSAPAQAGDDPAPWPAESADGMWKVETHHADPRSLVASRRRPDSLPLAPFAEMQARLAAQADRWHAEDAAAAERREDWHAAAFHLGQMSQRAVDDEIRQRRERALKRLDAARRQAAEAFPGNTGR